MKIEYIKAAIDACNYVFTICPLGSANKKNTPAQNASPAYQALVTAKHDFHEQIASILNQPKLSEEEQYLSIIYLLDSIARRSQAGNCQELAAVAFLFLMERNILPIEIVSIPTHTFVIIGRDQTTPIHQPELWNKETVICDPWRREGLNQPATLFSHDESMVFDAAKLQNYLCGELKQLKVGFGLYEPIGLLPTAFSAPQ